MIYILPWRLRWWCRRYSRLGMFCSGASRHRFLLVRVIWPSPNLMAAKTRIGSRFRCSCSCAGRRCSSMNCRSHGSWRTCDANWWSHGLGRRRRWAHELATIYVERLCARQRLSSCARWCRMWRSAVPSSAWRARSVRRARSWLRRRDVSTKTQRWD